MMGAASCLYRQILFENRSDSKPTCGRILTGMSHWQRINEEKQHLMRSQLIGAPHKFRRLCICFLLHGLRPALRCSRLVLYFQAEFSGNVTCEGIMAASSETGSHGMQRC